MISDDIDRAVGSGVRDIVNYSSWIMRTTISFGDGNWQKIVLKHGEAMWLRVRDKFEVQNGLPEHKLQGFVISTMQRLFRAWKARLHVIYSSYDNDKDRLSHHPGDVELDDWKHLVKYFGSDEFKINPLTGEKETPDKIWEIQYTFKNVNGERVRSIFLFAFTFHVDMRSLSQVSFENNLSTSMSDNKMVIIDGSFAETTKLSKLMVAWKSKKQTTISRSSAESEYRSLASTIAELVWLIGMLKEIGFELKHPATVYCDSKFALQNEANPVFHERTKHIEIDLHFIREKLQQGIVQTEYINTKEQPTDLLTKGLTRD
ncbi:putative transcriptional regulator STERILE APETALA-like [Capsicum annuum]|nr:putative transcriptional regulator STERILE APETALA-like [Capsicum annuum]